MKKLIALALLGAMLLSLLSGCGLQTANYAFNLAEQPVANDRSLAVSSNTVSIFFKVPEAGLFKLLTYDNTDYKEWPEQEPSFYADLLNDKGETLYEQVNIFEPTDEAYVVEKGTLQVIITAKNTAEDFKSIALSWAYAASEKDTVEIVPNKAVATQLNDKGEATFSLTTDKATIMRVETAEACTWDSDCVFSIVDVNGNKMADKLLVHGAEWTSRLVYLPAGKYTLTVSDGQSLVTCLVTEYTQYGDDQIASNSSDSLPAVFGFTASDDGKATATLTPTEKDKQLVISAVGSGTYYDNEQTVNIAITDAAGELIYEDTVEGETYIDIAEWEGAHSIAVEVTDSCVVELKTTESELPVSTFSYEQDMEDYAEDPGVKTSGFRNTRKAIITLPENAVQLAKNEAVTEYDSVDVAYDKTAAMWRVSLWNENMEGGSIDIYMDDNGITQATISWE